MQDEIDDMNKYLYNDGGVQDQLGDINDIIHTTVLKASEEVTVAVDNISSGDDYISQAHPSIIRTTVIGTDANGKAYIAEKLIGEKIILVFENDDKEVYFWGQYNEKYHWDGYCLTNAYYKDGTLFGICESNFDDGKRLDYVSFYHEGDNEWTYSNRVVNGKSNTGISVWYYSEVKNRKNFTNRNVRVSDFILPDDYIKNNEFRMKKFYSGNTSEGRYNDDTGDAYEIIYSSDGTVKTLYCGNFCDGMFEDDTGNAWDIAYSEKQGLYLYNKGVFKNGHATVNCITKIVHIDEIKDIIGDKKFESELKWK